MMTIVACRRYYDKKRFSKVGVNVLEIYFRDGSTPNCACFDRSHAFYLDFTFGTTSPASSPRSHVDYLLYPGHIITRTIVVQ